MANVEFNDYRPEGTASEIGPIAIAEGSSYTTTLLEETGLPNGDYFISVQSTWMGVHDKYMELSAIIQGVESIAVAKNNGAPTTGTNSASGWGIVAVTDGTLSYHLKYTFPNQGGGSADGSILAAQAYYRRVSDA